MSDIEIRTVVRRDVGNGFVTIRREGHELTIPRRIIVRRDEVTPARPPAASTAPSPIEKPKRG